MYNEIIVLVPKLCIHVKEVGSLNEITVFIFFCFIFLFWIDIERQSPSQSGVLHGT